MVVEFARATGEDALGPWHPWVRKTTRLSERKFRLRFDGTEETRSRLLEECLRIGPISSYFPAVPTLEDAYREIVAAGAPGVPVSENPADDAAPRRGEAAIGGAQSAPDQAAASPPPAEPPRSVARDYRRRRRDRRRGPYRLGAVSYIFPRPS